MAGSKDGAQRRDPKVDNGTLLSSDRTSCGPDPAWEVSNKAASSSLRRKHTPRGREHLAPTGISHLQEMSFPHETWELSPP